MNDEELKEVCLKLFELSTSDRTLVNKVPRRRCQLGDLSGYLHPRGYRYTSIQGKSYAIHRLVFLMYNSYLPELVDHIDGDTSNNLPHNLREASRSTNAQNVKCLRINNISGYKGVSRYGDRWRACIGLKGNRHLGVFVCRHEAARVYNLASRMYHGSKSKINIIKQ